MRYRLFLLVLILGSAAGVFGQQVEQQSFREPCFWNVGGICFSYQEEENGSAMGSWGDSGSKTLGVNGTKCYCNDTVQPNGTTCESSGSCTIR